MAKNNFKNFSYLLMTVFLTLGLSMSFQSLLAVSTWTAPKANPPGCEPGDPGCDEPVNKGIGLQIKSGPLWVNAGPTPAATGFVALGNVGIGTSSPLFDLHVYDSQTGPDASIIAVDGVVDAQVGYNILKNGILRWQMLVSDDGAEDLRFWEGDDKYGFGAQKNQVVFKAGGNVGIGTMYPEGKLHVQGLNDAASVVAFMPGAETGAAGTASLNVGIGTTTPGGQLTIVSPTANRGTIEVFNLNYGNNDIRFNGGSDSLFAFWNYGSSTGATWFRSTAVDPILYLENTGNVGIGTDDPWSPLSVVRDGTPVSGLTDSKVVALFEGETFPRGIWLGYNRGTENVALIGADVNAELSSNLGFVIYDSGTWSEAMRITNLGKVGIGTTSPQARLDLGQLPAATEGLKIKIGATNPYSPLAIVADNNAEVFRVKQDGKVSVGVADYSPASPIPFRVHSASGWALPGTTNVYSVAEFDYSDNFTGVELGYSTSGNHVAVIAADTNENGNESSNLAFYTANSGSSVSVFAERMRITGSGNVGIGTAAPSAALHVISNAGGGIRFEPPSNIDNWFVYAPFGALSSAAPQWNVGQLSTKEYTIRTWDGTSNIDRLTVAPSGNVGIGTTNPGAKLEVNGTAMFSGGLANRAVCWKGDGKTLGYCLNTPTDGICTCN